MCGLQTDPPVDRDLRGPNPTYGNVTAGRAESNDSHRYVTDKLRTGLTADIFNDKNLLQTTELLPLRFNPSHYSF